MPLGTWFYAFVASLVAKRSSLSIALAKAANLASANVTNIPTCIAGDNMDFLGGLLGAGLNFFNASSNRKAQEEMNNRNIAFQTQANENNIAFQRETNAQLLADKDRDRALQKEFAQSGVQWRSADALAAGIHPIYALGGAGASYSPSAVSLGSPSVKAPSVSAETLDLGNMGQDISRAIASTKSQADRDISFNETVKKLSLQKMGLENELLGTQIAKQRGQIGPPMPVSQSSGSDAFVGPQQPHGYDKLEDTPQLQTAGGRWETDRTISPMKSWEDRYGDEGPAAKWMPYYILYNDAKANYPWIGKAQSAVYGAINKADAYSWKAERFMRDYYKSTAPYRIYKEFYR